MTVLEAAAALGVNQQRIRALIASGRLKARRIGARVWLIDRRSVETFQPNPPGRPRAIAK